jgi:hypothetical protein
MDAAQCGFAYVASDYSRFVASLCRDVAAIVVTQQLTVSAPRNEWKLDAAAARQHHSW